MADSDTTSTRWQRRLAREPWVSARTASRLTGISVWHINQAITAGSITTRKTDSSRVPAIDRDSLLEWAKRWRKGRANHQRAVDRRQAQRETRAEDRSGLPPDEDHDWLSREQTAQRLGISVPRVGQLATKDRIPHTRSGRRTWFRADLVELYAAARRASRERDA
jgi:excisionase family DNA binding protein